jgi:hypothetical protein
MKTQYRKKVSKKHLFREFVKVINGLLQLSTRESEILALLMSIDYNWKPVTETEVKNILSTDNRRALMQETRVNKNNLTKYINILRNKGLLIGGKEEGYYINPMFMPKDTSGIIEVVFVLDVEK